IRFAPQEGLLPRGVDPVRLFEDLESLGTLVVHADVSAVPPLADVTPGDCRVRWELLLTSPMPKASIELIFDWAEGDCELSIERADGPATAQAGTPAAAAPETRATEAAAEAAPAAMEDLPASRPTLEAVEDLPAAEAPWCRPLPARSLIPPQHRRPRRPPWRRTRRPPMPPATLRPVPTRPAARR